jgi:hypothetical protein
MVRVRARGHAARVSRSSVVVDDTHLDHLAGVLSPFELM